MNKQKYFRTKNFICGFLIASVLLTACGAIDEPGQEAVLATSEVSADSSSEPVSDNTKSNADSDTSAAAESSEQEQTEPVKGSRDNTPLNMFPSQPGTDVYGNDLVEIDASNTSEGYISVSYTGSCSKVKLQITCPNTTTYTYNLSGGYEVFPLTPDSGNYRFAVFENIQGTEYSTAFTQDIDITIENEFGAYLYPNQYVWFTPESKIIDKGIELSEMANSDLDVVTSVYNFMIENVTYDKELANTVESGYVPTPDNTLASNKGICLDYASLMSSMLRSQGIPTHMEVGYAGNAYHSWISVYLDEIGWVNGIIEFNGTDWEMMDPTFAASADEATLREFIGDGTNYLTKYTY